MALEAPAINLMLDSLAAVALRASLHSDDPGTAGINEIATSPYERKAIAWATASAKSAAQSGTAVFDLPSGVTVTHVGLWNVAGDVYYGTADVPDETFSSSGSLTVQNASISGT